jgi:hypothetical protein
VQEDSLSRPLPKNYLPSFPTSEAWDSSPSLSFYHCKIYCSFLKTLSKATSESHCLELVFSQVMYTICINKLVCFSLVNLSFVAGICSSYKFKKIEENYIFSPSEMRLEQLEVITSTGGCPAPVA